MIENPAKNVVGFLTYNPFDGKHYFRVYDEQDKRKFVDYKICAEDIEVQILSKWCSLYEGDEKDRLDWSSKTLGKS